jgi:hypothetical protein
MKINKMELIEEINEKILEKELAETLYQNIETNTYGKYRPATEIDPPEEPEVETTLDIKEYMLDGFKIGVITVEVDDDTDMYNIESKQFNFQGDLYVELDNYLKLYFNYRLNADQLDLVNLYDLRK